MSKKRMTVYLGIVLLLITAVLFQGTRSGEVSKGYSTMLLNLFYRQLPSQGTVQYYLYLGFGYMLRKLAHIIEYTILAMVFFRVWTLYDQRIGRRSIYLRTLSSVGIVAIIDEVLQRTILGRTGQVRDVVLDLLGGCIGILIMKLLFKRKKDGKG